MSVVAQFTIPADQFILGEVLEVGSGPKIRLESMIPTGDSVVPYFWVDSDHADLVQETLGQSPLVTEVTLVDESESEALLRVRWSSDVDGLFELIRNTDAALLEAEGLGDDWAFRMRFPDRESLSGFYQACIEHGLTPELEEVNSTLSSPDSSDLGLSEPQREILLTALQNGYFDVPRETNLTGLATQLGISDTAASQRIRRGMKTLLTRTLAPRETEGDTDTSDE